MNEIYEASITGISEPQTPARYAAVIDRQLPGEYPVRWYELAVTTGQSHKKVLLAARTVSPERSVICEPDRIAVMVDDTVYEIDWRTGQPAASHEIRGGGELFRLNKFGCGYVIHGETEIIGLDGGFRETWSFSARDIFALPDGGDAFAVNGNNIEVRDFQGSRYILDANGRCVYDGGRET